MEDEKISGNFIKISENEEYLFLLIKMTTKKGANSIICSQIKHKIGKKIKIVKFKTLGLNFFSEINITETKNIKINISFLPKASSSAIGQSKNSGENKANT